MQITINAYLYLYDILKNETCIPEKCSLNICPFKYRKKLYLLPD